MCFHFFGYIIFRHAKTIIGLDLISDNHGYIVAVVLAYDNSEPEEPYIATLLYIP